MTYIQGLQKMIWGPPLLIILLGLGLYFMIRLKCIPIKRLIWSIKLALTGDKNMYETEGEQGISGASSLATELAATIGTGNIIGVVSAMTLGGPGALFWMVLSGALGMATKLVESTLAVKYRVVREKGIPEGGPMYTLARGLPMHKIGKGLGIVYAVFAMLCAFGMGNMVQANSISESLYSTLHMPKPYTGIILSILTILTIMGGIRMISGIALYLVPIMGGIYLAGCLGIVGLHIDRLPLVVRDIFLSAWHPGAVTGGVFGCVTVSMMDSVRFGVSRGVFSNEAGLGAAGITAAAVKNTEPAKQGFISMTGVFFDTLIICVITGLAYGCSGVPKEVTIAGEILSKRMGKIYADNSAGLMLAAFETAFGTYGGMILCVCITLFAFATILGWEYQGEVAFRFLFGKGTEKWFRLAYGILVLPGAIFTLDLVWGIADICNGLLAIPNLVALIILGPGICKEILEYSTGNSTGKMEE